MSDQPQGLQWEHPARANTFVKDAQVGRVLCDPPREKVAIVGYASSTRMQAPFDDPEYEIWGMNQLNRLIPRADRWFEMHSNYLEHVVEGTDYHGFLQTSKIPIYMCEAHPEYPNSVRFPIEQMTEAFTDYWTSSIAYMVGLAIFEGFTTIALYGIDLIIGEEYDYQKACVEYLIGEANGRGVNVIIAEASALMKSRYRYGYQQEFSLGMMSENYLTQQLQRYQQKKEKAVNEVYTADGAIQATQHLLYIAKMYKRGGNPISPQST